MAVKLYSKEINEELSKRGLLPENCFNVNVTLPLDGVIEVRYNCYASGELLECILETVLEINKGVEK